MNPRIAKKHLLAGITLLIGCQPVAHADWRDYIPSPKIPTLPSRQDLSTFFLNNYGLIGGTLAVFGIAAALWVKFFSSEAHTA